MADKQGQTGNAKPNVTYKTHLLIAYCGTSKFIVGEWAHVPTRQELKDAVARSFGAATIGLSTLALVGVVGLLDPAEFVTSQNPKAPQDSELIF